MSTSGGGVATTPSAESSGHTQPDPSRQHDQHYATGSEAHSSDRQSQAPSSRPSSGVAMMPGENPGQTHQQSGAQHSGAETAESAPAHAQVTDTQHAPGTAASPPIGQRQSSTPPPSNGLLQLRIVRPTGHTGATGIPDGPFTIGKQPDCDLVIEQDTYVSRRHAELVRSNGSVILKDLGSSNGTYLRLTRPTELMPGDEIQVGTTIIRLEPIENS
ncbi:MAG: FHA domain-containing protein [Planctomycetes bacterium]|nr:FHA domain-containing protein [Planctomycetota bacterium]